MIRARLHGGDSSRRCEGELLLRFEDRDIIPHVRDCVVHSSEYETMEHVGNSAKIRLSDS